MKQSIKNYCARRLSELETIPEDRKVKLDKIAAYIRYKESDPIDLVFICTHNSRRSIFGQVWAKIAAYHFGLTNVETHSAGTETTEIASNVVYTLMSLGFDLVVEGEEDNSRHFFIFDDQKNTCICYSKTLDDNSLPKEEFGAILTCTAADADCPMVIGAELRVSTPFEDPKASDGTSEAQQKYRACSNQIAREMLYVFSKATE